MSMAFNADEIFEIAEQIERNGGRYYRRAAETLAADKARSLLLGLAEMEKRHEAVFSAMHQTLKQHSPDWLPEGAGADGLAEEQAYLRAIADGRVFDFRTDPAAQITGRMSLADILRKAIGLEKNSIVFYLGVQKMVPKELGGDKIGDIIREEMRHITSLTNELAAQEKQ